MPRKKNALHDAHVREMRDEVQRFSEQLDGYSSDDAHVEMRREAMTPEEQGRRREHARDFTAAIKRTTFFKAYPNQQIVMQIDDALNEYHDLRAAREQRTEQERVARETAQSLIKALRCAFEDVAKNSLATAVVIEAFCQSDKPAELDERIANLARAIDSLQGPSGKRGARAQPELVRLIQRLAHLVVSAREQAARTAYSKAQAEAEQATSDEDEAARNEAEAAKRTAVMVWKAAKIDDETAQGYIIELLEAGNVWRAADTLETHMTSSRRRHYLEVAATQAIELEQLATPIIHPKS